MLVRFEGETRLVSIAPDLVRVLTTTIQIQRAEPLSTEHIITQLRELLPAIGDNDDR